MTVYIDRRIYPSHIHSDTHTLHFYLIDVFLILKLDPWRESPIILKALFHVKELSYYMTANYVVNIYFPINDLKELSEVNQKYFCDSGRIIYYKFILDTGKKIR